MTRPSAAALAALALLTPAPARSFLGLPWFDRLKAPFEKIDPLFAEGRHREALAALKALPTDRLRNADERLYYLKLGRAHEALGRLDRALGAYQVAVEKFPRDPRVLLALGQLYHRIDLDARANPLFRRVLELEPGNAGAHLGLAESLRALGDLRRASERYAAALRGGLDRDPDAVREAASTLLEQRRFEEAERTAERSLAAGESPKAFLVLARARRALGRKDDAARALARGEAAFPELPEFGALRALWLLRDGRVEAAEAEAGSLGARFPGLAIAAWVEAEAALRRGEDSKAAKLLGALEELEESDPFVARAARAARLAVERSRLGP